MDNYEARHSADHEGENPRRRPKPPKWKTVLRYYVVPIVLVLALVAVIVVMITGITGCVNGNSGATGGSTTAATTDPTTEPTSEPTTEPTVPQAEVDAAAAELIKKTDLLAAGYYYDEAITAISAFEHLERSPAATQKLAEYQAAKASAKRYEDMDTITHIFFHSLIVDTDRAFGKGSYQKGGYNQWMTTVDEFKFLLNSMYERGFVLVTPYQVAYEITDENGKAKFVEGDIYLPEGKKPFLMSQDDLNYYGNMIADSDAGINSTPVFVSKKGDGFAHKLIIGEDGKPTCEYMDKDGNIHVGEYDLVPILEAFIQEHPDFAYRGARAVLGVTGYEGVFGYRVKPSYAKNMTAEAYAKEVEDAKAITKCLKDNGWIIASHSYGHPNYSFPSEKTAQGKANRVAKDVAKFKERVEFVIGECDIIIYPHGADVAGNEKYTLDNPSFKVLYEAGYRYFFNVNSSDYWVQMGEDYYRGGRRNVDGYRMWYHPYKLDDLMGKKTIQYYDKNKNLVTKEVSEAFDAARPCPVPQV